MKLSVIIVNYNVKYFLEQCLLSVTKAAKLVETEVFVVDNNSVDGSCEMVQSRFGNVHLIENKTNTGFAKANNQAIKLAKGEYVLLLNPDTVVEEDTFLKCVNFMDQHADAGGLGVYMIDGKGNFLPESKRGLPSPAVAFYKIFGLSVLFPKSKIFGRYHLGFLDKNKTSTVDVLSGAFMMLRKNVLDQTGLLDESFFMYGEDIDLSYRITKSGYKNYYFPETRIIHYKGESTKKSSINYVFVFYRAMIIFAGKHFSKQNARLFSFFINFAVYLRALLALSSRLFKRILITLVDALLIYGGVRVIQWYWETNIKAFHYPAFFDYAIVPAYMVIWLTAIWLSGGYDKPVKISKAIRGLLSGSILILVVYSLLPETMRFSRAMILLGTAWACLIVPVWRWLLHLTGIGGYTLASNTKKRIAMVGSEAECMRVYNLMQSGDANIHLLGFIEPDAENKIQNERHLGYLYQLNDIVEVFKVDELIFCAVNVTSQQIINTMMTLTSPDVEFKIAPVESSYIIGSNSSNSQGNFYFVDINALGNAINKRNKRLLDLVLSVLFLLLYPLLILKVKPAASFFNNIMQVLKGHKSWVGLASTKENETSRYRKGVLTPLDLNHKMLYDAQTTNKLNMLYAREYSIYKDIEIIWKNIKLIGRP